MNLLIDISAGRTIVRATRAIGHDAAFVRDRDREMVDEDILAWAVSERRVVVTMDKDFGELVFRLGLPHAGVLLMRTDGARSAERVAAVTSVLDAYGDQLPERFAVYQNGRVRFR